MSILNKMETEIERNGDIMKVRLKKKHTHILLIMKCQFWGIGTK